MIVGLLIIQSPGSRPTPRDGSCKRLVCSRLDTTPLLDSLLQHNSFFCIYCLCSQFSSSQTIKLGHDICRKYPLGCELTLFFIFSIWSFKQGNVSCSILCVTGGPQPSGWQKKNFACSIWFKLAWFQSCSSLFFHRKPRLSHSATSGCATDARHQLPIEVPQACLWVNFLSSTCA